MKRKGKPTFSGIQTNTTNKQIQTSGPSISDLPMTLFVDILLKLCTKNIILCKCVCKSWHTLISDPQFAKLHFAQAKTCILIQNRHSSFSRSVHLLEPEDGRTFDVGYCWCGSVKEKCKRCRLNIKVKAKLKMPLWNAEVMFSQAGDDMNVIFSTHNNSKIKNLIKLGSYRKHRYWLANSCNGLLCLTAQSGCDAVVVCNPILDEFIYLPKSSNYGSNGSNSRVALGFNPKNNQYKVIRMFIWVIKDPTTGCFLRFGDIEAEIQTLGTDSWRSVPITSFKLEFHNDYPIYHDGALHWIYRDVGSESIVSFDMEEELFHLYSIPSPLCQQGKHLDIGILDDSLCVYDSCAYDHHIDIWVMKHTGVCESWSKLFSIDIANGQGSTPLDYLDYHHYRPLIYVNNGALLMFHSPQNKLMYYDDLGGLRYKLVKFRGIEGQFEAIAHTPSLISLKDIVMMGKVEVLNVNSRCGKLQLAEENYPLFLGSTKII